MSMKSFSEKARCSSAVQNGYLKISDVELSISSVALSALQISPARSMNDTLSMVWLYFLISVSTDGSEDPWAWFVIFDVV